ncbi:hypothetical protein AYY27_19085 [Photobacterium damselae]|uniref:OmpA family protein n=1 Tax=Photobacterium damselae TaxID=38293 RepID=A0ABD6WYN7_PHODM|nr:hypothetical protein AYY27_19085 [Photobacterium damselae]PSU14494.1 OmpA family protein [Photobacterium damselae]
MKSVIIKYLLSTVWCSVLTACTLWPEPKPLPPITKEQQHQLEHYSWELKLLEARGVKLCLPAQYQKLDWLYQQAYQEFVAGFPHDAELTLQKYQFTADMIDRQMDWLEFHTHCFNHYSEVELREQLELYFAVDNQFALNRSELLPAYQQALTQAAAILKRHRHWHVKLVGHTDTQGQIQDNYHLGLTRANNVKRFLLEHGVNGHQVSVLSAGESQAVPDTHSRTMQLANRQVAAEILVSAHNKSPHRHFSLKDWPAMRTTP